MLCATTKWVRCSNLCKMLTRQPLLNHQCYQGMHLWIWLKKKKPQLQWHATEQNQYMFCTCKGWEIDLQIQRVHRRDLLHLKTYLITLIVSLGMLLNHGVRIKWMIKSEWGVSEISLSCVIVRVETLTGVCVPIWNSRFMWGSSPSFHYHYHPFVDGHHYLPLEDRLNPILKVVYIQKKAVFVHSKGSERSWSRILLPPPPPPEVQQLYLSPTPIMTLPNSAPAFLDLIQASQKNVVGVFLLQRLGNQDIFFANLIGNFHYNVQVVGIC